MFEAGNEGDSVKCLQQILQVRIWKSRSGKNANPSFIVAVAPC